MQKVKIKGLAAIAGWIFFVWGAVVSCKGIWDLFLGEPESNFYSPEKWDFVTRQQWFKWSGFELAYGIACVAIAVLLWKYAKRLPEYIERKDKQVI